MLNLLYWLPIFKLPDQILSIFYLALLPPSWACLAVRFLRHEIEKRPRVIKRELKTFFGIDLILNFWATPGSNSLFSCWSEHHIWREGGAHQFMVEVKRENLSLAFVGFQLEFQFHYSPAKSKLEKEKWASHRVSDIHLQLPNSDSYTHLSFFLSRQHFIFSFSNIIHGNAFKSWRCRYGVHIISLYWVGIFISQSRIS